MYGLIAVVVIAAIAFFVLQSKKKTTPAKGTAAKKATTPAASQSNSAPKATEADIQNTIDKVDKLIAEQAYDRAESLLNFRLKQNSTSEPLYHKLLEVYHYQDNDLAVKQLLETVQSLHLNTVYQKLYSDHEAYQAQRATQTSIGTPSHTSPIGKQDHTATSGSANSLSAFDDLDQDLASTTNEPLDFNLSTPSVQEDTTATSNTLEFSTSPAPAEPTAQSNAPLTFTLDEPSESQPQQSSPSLEFSLEEPSETPAPAENTLAFKLDEPAPVTEEAPSFSFSLEEPASDTAAPAPTIDLADSALQTTASQFADPNDPIVEFFPQLAEVDPIDLDLDLAAHYIRLGKKDAAQQLISSQSQLSGSQSEKAAQLQQRLS